MNSRWLFHAIVIICWPSFLLAGEPSTIVIGQEVSKHIKNGETHRYQITLNRKPTQIIIKPSYFDVAINMHQLNSEKILRANSPPLVISDEYIVVTPEHKGEYIIEIEWVSQNFSTGDYTLIVSTPPLSQNQLVAAFHTTEAAKIRIDSTSAEKKEALKTYQLSAMAWQKSGNGELQARSLIYAGWLAWELGDLQTAESSFIKALALEHENDTHNAWLHAYLGVINLEQDDFVQAEKFIRQALTYSREYNEHRGTASFLNYMGLISQFKNQPVAAAAWYLKALAVLESIDYPHQKAQTLSNIGGTQYQMGGFKEALEYYQSALSIHQHLNNQNEQAMVLGNMASLYRDQGDLSESLQYNLLTLKIYKNLNDEKGQNLVYHRLGILFHRMGDYQRSEVYFIRAYEGRKQTKSKRNAASSLRSIGAMYSESGNLNKAIKSHNEALSLYTQINSKINIAKTQVALAGILIRKNELVKANNLLVNAIPLLEKAKLFPDLADALIQLGHINANVGNTEIAKAQFNRVLEIQRSVFDPIGEIDALIALGQLEQDPRKSIIRLGSAELVALKVYQSVANPALRARFSATLQKLYDRIIETYLLLHKLEPDHGHEKSAFMASERNRARSLLALISSSKVATSTERSKHLEKQKKLRRRLNGLWDSVNKSTLRSNNKEIMQLTASNKNAIADVMTQLDNLTIQLSQKNKSDTETETFSLQDIQSSLSADELLLHLHVGKTKSAIWNISHNHISVNELPAQNVIEKIARNAYKTLLNKKFEKSDKAILSKLTKLLIQDPNILVGKRNVYVVADGFLQYIPFGVLVDEINNFLVESTTFLNLPSSRSLLHRPALPVFNKNSSLLVYSDPIFGDNDFRAQQTNDTLLFASELSQAASQVGLKSVSRLAFSAIEAAKIAISIPLAKVVSGFDANKQDVFSRDIKNTEILHFATHGIINDNYPVLSGLIFSLIDKDNIPLDGFLSAADISTLPMNPKLVVLSACETGVGEAVPGEGLLSLARVFLSQGSENVVSSLWRVDDQATAELMGHFYHALVVRQDSIALALRYAQQQIASQAQWKAPYYWAGFIISSANPGFDTSKIK